MTIFIINTKSVLFEHVPHGRNGLIDSLRVIFNDYDTDNELCTYVTPHNVITTHNVIIAA